MNSPKPLLEKEIQRQILDYLSKAQILHWRNNAGQDPTFMRFSPPGSPDIYALDNGTLYGIEVKAEKGKQSEDQKAFQERFEQAGGVYHVVRSVEEVQQIFP